MQQIPNQYCIKGSIRERKRYGVGGSAAHGGDVVSKRYFGRREVNPEKGALPIAEMEQVTTFAASDLQKSLSWAHRGLEQASFRLGKVWSGRLPLEVRR